MHAGHVLATDTPPSGGASASASLPWFAHAAPPTSRKKPSGGRTGAAAPGRSGGSCWTR